MALHNNNNRNVDWKNNINDSLDIYDPQLHGGNFNEMIARVQLWNRDLTAAEF